MVKINKTYTIGIDIGGTNMKSILFDGESVIADDMLATPKDSLDHFMIMLYALIDPLLEKAQKDRVKVKGIGIGAPGVLDLDKRRILKNTAINIRIIEGADILGILEQKYGLPCFLDNDAKCFIRAEALCGAGKKYENIYGIIIGTGIGGGWWFNKEVYMGPHGGAGEPGYMVINFENKILLEEAYHKLTQNNPAGIAEEAFRGDLLAEKIYQELGTYLGLAFANIANIIDPEAFIIGGSVIESASLFLKYAKKALHENTACTNSKSIPILKSKLGKKAGAIGAALLVA
jgi:glucokinase